MLKITDAPYSNITDDLKWVIGNIVMNVHQTENSSHLAEIRHHLTYPLLRLASVIKPREQTMKRNLLGLIALLAVPLAHADGNKEAADRQ